MCIVATSSRQAFDSEFAGLLIDVADLYSRVVVKFWTKSTKLVLVLECRTNITKKISPLRSHVQYSAGII